MCHTIFALFSPSIWCVWGHPTLTPYKLQFFFINKTGVLYINRFFAYSPYNLTPCPACYPFKIMSFVTGVLEQPDRETLVYNAMMHVHFPLVISN